MKQTSKAILLALSALLLTGSAASADGFEITPWAGYRLFGGGLGGYDLEEDGAYGLMLDIPTGYEYAAIELYYSYQGTQLSNGGVELFDVNEQVLHAGLRHSFKSSTSLKPYAAWGLGITILDPDVALSETTRFSVGLAAGARYMPGSTVGLRFEARGLMTYVNAGEGIFCTDGKSDCAVQTQTESLWQVDFLVGLIIAP